MGLIGAGAVLVALLISLTLLPAMLGFAGDKVLPSRRSRRASWPNRPASALSAGQRWAAFVVRRRMPLAIAAIAVLVLFALPALHLSLGLPDKPRPATPSSQLASSPSSRRASGLASTARARRGRYRFAARSRSVAQIESALARRSDVLTT